MKKSNTQKNLAKRSGFTLIEIILVVVIIGILAGIAIPKIAGRSEKAKITQAKANINVLDSAIDEYEMLNSTYPSSLDDLLDTSKGGPFLKKPKIPLDPWGNEFVYTNPGQHNSSFDIYATGHEDDANNWD